MYRRNQHPVPLPVHSAYRPTPACGLPERVTCPAYRPAHSADRVLPGTCRGRRPTWPGTWSLAYWQRQLTWHETRSRWPAAGKPEHVAWGIELATYRWQTGACGIPSLPHTACHRKTERADRACSLSPAAANPSVRSALPSAYPTDRQTQPVTCRACRLPTTNQDLWPKPAAYAPHRPNLGAGILSAQPAIPAIPASDSDLDPENGDKWWIPMVENLCGASETRHENPPSTPLLDPENGPDGGNGGNGGKRRGEAPGGNASWRRKLDPTRASAGHDAGREQSAHIRRNLRTVSVLILTTQSTTGRVSPMPQRVPELKTTPVMTTAYATDTATACKVPRLAWGRPIHARRRCLRTFFGLVCVKVCRFDVPWMGSPLHGRTQQHTGQGGEGPFYVAGSTARRSHVLL
jgi:hypothetical protein